MTKIGDRLKQRRIKIGKTLEEVGKDLGISKSTVHKYESGMIPNIPSDKIEKFAKSLNCSPAYIMGWEDENANDYPKSYTLNDGEYYFDGFSAKINLVNDEPYISITTPNGDDLFEIDPQTGKVDIGANLEKAGLNIDILAPLIFQFFGLSNKEQKKSTSSNKNIMNLREKDLMRKYRSLNESGKQKAMEYIDDLLVNEKYVTQVAAVNNNADFAMVARGGHVIMPNTPITRADIEELAKQTQETADKENEEDL